MSQEREFSGLSDAAFSHSQGHLPTFRSAKEMSALPSEADTGTDFRHVSFGPIVLKKSESRTKLGWPLRVAGLFRPAVGWGWVSVWPASEGSGQLLRGGTRHGHHLVLVIAVDQV
jgi:hypothetical protein